MKNAKHLVSDAEAEQVFFNESLLVLDELAEKLERAVPAPASLSAAAKRFIASDKRKDNVSQESKRLLREHFRGK